MAVRNVTKTASSPRGKGRPVDDLDKVGRQSILLATRELLLEAPYTKITRISVAKKAGIAPSLIRYYFEDLTALLTEILQIMMKELRHELAQISNRQLTAREKLALRVRYLVKFFTKNPAFHQMFVDLVINSDTDWAEKTRVDFTKTAFGEFSDLVDNAKKNQQVLESIDSRFLYILFIGSTEFFTSGKPIFQQLFKKGEWDSALIDKYADFLTALIFQGIEKR